MVSLLEQYLVPDGLVLEGGAGGGRTSLELKVKHPDLSVVLLDINRRTVKNAKSVYVG